MNPRPGVRITRRGIVLSLAAHFLVGVAVWFSPIVQRPGIPPEPRPIEQVEYLDLAAWPEGVPGGTPSPAAAPAGPGHFAEPGAPDSASGGALPPFPQQAPAAIPRSSGGGVAPGAGPRVGVPGGTGTDYSTGPRTGAAGGRLGAELGDRRLIVPPRAATDRPLTDHERFEGRLADQVRAINDSAQAENARQRRLRNWTVKDKDGREWGFGEGGGVMVAGRRIPVPIPSPNVGRDQYGEEAEREKNRQWRDTHRQGEEADRDNNLRDRARATRARVDEDRRRARAGAKPDTAS
ncbi:MAG TPA: hypothetical protein VE913_11365 [Longimicrobium sp.]|nr:hypothetical protein [Longimicrobium sp.]